MRAWSFCMIAAYLVAGLCASGLHSSQAIIISGNGVVMLNALLGTALFVDFHQRKGWRVVLYQPHLRRHCHHSGHWRDGGSKRKKTGYKWERDRDGGAKGGNTMEGSQTEKRAVEIVRRKEIRRGQKNKVNDKQAVNIWLHSLTVKFYHSVNHKT